MQGGVLGAAPERLSTRKSAERPPRSAGITELKSGKSSSSFRSSVSKGFRSATKGVESVAKGVGNQVSKAASQTGKAMAWVADKMVESEPPSSLDKHRSESDREYFNYYRQWPSEDESSPASSIRPSVDKTEVGPRAPVKPTGPRKPKEPKLRYRPVEYEDRKRIEAEANYHGERVDIPLEVPDHLRYNREMEKYKKDMEQYTREMLAAAGGGPLPTLDGLKSSVRLHALAELKLKQPEVHYRPASEGERQEALDAARYNNVMADVPDLVPDRLRFNLEMKEYRKAKEKILARTQFAPAQSASEGQPVDSPREPGARAEPGTDTAERSAKTAVAVRMSAMLEKISPEQISANEEPASFAALAQYLAQDTGYKQKVMELSLEPSFGSEVKRRWALLALKCEMSDVDLPQLLRNNAHTVTAFLALPDAASRNQVLEAIRQAAGTQAAEQKR